VTDPDHKALAAPKLNIVVAHHALGFLDASASSRQVNGSNPMKWPSTAAAHPAFRIGRWMELDPDQARMAVEQQSSTGARGRALARRILNRRAHQTMEERNMNEGIEQFLATIEQCLDEHDMQPPLVVRTVGDNGSVLAVGFNEGAELVVLTKHCEDEMLPIKVTIVSQNNRTARLVIERDGNIGRFH
jgi:hypothetical protein